MKQKKYKHLKTGFIFKSIPVMDSSGDYYYESENHITKKMLLSKIMVEESNDYLEVVLHTEYRNQEVLIWEGSVDYTNWVRGIKFEDYPYTRPYKLSFCKHLIWTEFTAGDYVELIGSSIKYVIRTFKLLDGAWAAKFTDSSLWRLDDLKKVSVDRAVQIVRFSELEERITQLEKIIKK